MINTVIDLRREDDPPEEVVVRRILLEQHQAFRAWWNLEGNTDGLSERERIVYAQIPDRGVISLDELLKRLDARLMPLLESLQILCGSGLVREPARERYEISTHLFRIWTQNQ